MDQHETPIAALGLSRLAENSLQVHLGPSELGEAGTHPDRVAARDHRRHGWGPTHITRKDYR